VIDKDFYWRLREFSDEFIKPQLLKVKMDMESICSCREVLERILKGTKEDTVLLDVGSGNRRLERELRKAGYRGAYKDCDTETRHGHDFQNIVDVIGKFDIITMFDLIEHISFAEAYSLFKPSLSLLKPNGRIIISTPNAAHINCIWKTDMTHVQQYPYPQLCGLLRMSGFKGAIEVYRIHMMPDRGYIKNFIFDTILVPTHRVFTKFLDVDFAQEILVIARKGD